MKYKLINKQTKEETLCDKITIDGFDYYVSDELPSIGDKSVLQVEGFSPMVLTHFEECEFDYEGKKIIATNNPNIDIPKVIDEVKVLANLHKVNISEDWSKASFIKGYNKSQETHPFSEADMIEFGEWKDYNFYQHIEDNLYKTMQARPMYKVLENKSYTTKELLQLWKEQQPKIVYYGNDEKTRRRG